MTAPMQEAVVRGPHAAGFWQRATAWSLDALVPGLLALVFSWPLLAPALARLEAVTDAVLRELASAMAEALHAQIGGSAGLADLPLLLLPPTLQAAARLSPAVWAALWPPLLAFVVLLVAWFGGFEASRARASPGKRLLGLRVTGADGDRLGLGQALARQLAGSLSWATLNLGHLMALAGPEHRALHDRLARTRVVAARRGLPAWAWPWLLFAMLAPVAAAGWLGSRMAARLQYLLEQAFWY